MPLWHHLCSAAWLEVEKKINEAPRLVGLVILLFGHTVQVLHLGDPLQCGREVIKTTGEHRLLLYVSRLSGAGGLSGHLAPLPATTPIIHVLLVAKHVLMRHWRQGIAPNLSEIMKLVNVNY